MVTINKKTQQLKVFRSEEEDYKNIFSFYQKHFKYSQPAHLKNTLESRIGISIVAYHEEKLVGHVLLYPLTSKLNIGFENAGLITGIRTLGNDIVQKIVRETILCAWESGFHALFCFEDYPQLKNAGFIEVQNSYFAMKMMNYRILGMELSWKGFQKISHDLIVPVSFLPPIDKLNQISKN